MTEQTEAGQRQGFLIEVDHMGPFQSVFSLVYGTKTTFVTMVDDLHWEVDPDVCVALVILQDFSVAFDNIDYSILLNCLSGLGL